MPIFFEYGDQLRALQTIQYYCFEKPQIRLSHLFQLSSTQQNQILRELHEKHPKIVDIVSYVFMENHWHFLLIQNQDKGISTFMSRISDSFTKYINTRHNRVGPLFQGQFRAIRLITDNQLVHVSRYIHLNPLVGNAIDKKNFLKYEWSSMKDFAIGKSNFYDLMPVLSFFKSPEDYVKFVIDQEDYSREIKRIQHLLLEK